MSKIAIEDLANEGKNIMRTIADSYVEEGYFKSMMAGEEKGIEKGREAIAINVMSKFQAFIHN